MNSIDAAYRQFIRKRFSLPSEDQVAQLEQQLGVPFPADYRRFVLEYNGGYFTEPDIVPVSDGCPDDCLTFMHGIGASHSCAELGDPELIANFDDNEPAQVVPIGYTLMGNLILLLTQGDDVDVGSIVLKKAFSDDWFFLADGIENFFKLLKVFAE